MLKLCWWVLNLNDVFTWCHLLKVCLSLLLHLHSGKCSSYISRIWTELWPLHLRYSGSKSLRFQESKPPSFSYWSEMIALGRNNHLKTTEQTNVCKINNSHLQQQMMSVKRRQKKSLSVRLTEGRWALISLMGLGTHCTLWCLKAFVLLVPQVSELHVDSFHFINFHISSVFFVMQLCVYSCCWSCWTCVCL